MMMTVPPSQDGSTFLLESRKRPLQPEATDVTEIKREKSDNNNGMEELIPYENGLGNNGGGALLPGQLILKVLIPGYAAGAVIGKGGQIIVQLQKESNATIKLSKAKDFYPGTQDRVVLIQGTADGLMKVQNTIIDKVYDFPVPKDLASAIGDRPKQVKIIVPNTTAGLVIGKAGATIRMIMEESGSKVQLSQKPEGVNVQERVITIKGEKHQLTAASNIIIDKIKDDPQSASCPHISYSGVVGPVANANPTGSPYAAGSTLIEPASNVATMLGYHIIQPGHQQMVQTATLPYLQHHHTSAASTPAPAQDIHQFNAATLQNYGYALSVIPGLHQTAAGLQALTGASNNGVIPVGNSVSPLPSATPLLSADTFQQVATSLPTAMPTARALSLPSGGYLTTPAYLTTNHHQQQLVSAANANGGFNTVHYQHAPTVSSPSTISIASAPGTPALSTQSQYQHQQQQQQQQHQQQQQQMYGLTVATGQQQPVSLISHEKTADGQNETIELAVAENLIGAILGRNGRTLVDYQGISGAKIQISKKGEHIPGTRNRRVSITGRTPCPQTAQFLITQRINSTQNARAQQLKLI